MDRHSKRPLKCGECGEVLRAERATVPYPESGLDNVWLINVPVWRCPNQHAEYEIPAAQALHDVLAEAIVEKPGPLVGQEIRYLRKHLGLGATAFSGYLGINPVSLSRIENAKRGITNTIDRLVRLLYGQLFAAQHATPCAKNLVTVLEGLRQRTLPSAGHRIEHLDLPSSWAPSATQTEWREIRP